MTFCCLPSKNCLRCRQRRLKCDRATPGCSQCRRAGKECAGYREELSLIFRDENARIIRRAAAARERARLKDEEKNGWPKSAPLSEPQALEVVASKPMNLGSPMPSISIDIDTQGLHFFFDRFATIPWTSGAYINRNNHIRLFDTLEIDPSFRNSVVSIGLAAMSNVKQDYALLNLARQRYGTAIRTVRKIVQNPSLHESRSLLKMIGMLVMYEFVDSRPENMSSWTTHVSGVAALLQNFPFIQAMQINVQEELWFYFGVMVKYFQVGGPFPVELNIWRTDRVSLPTENTWPAFGLIDILIKFIRLCATLPGRLETEAEEVAYEAIACEVELQNWADHLPARWTCIAKERTNAPGTFFGRYHVYQDGWAARVLNQYYLGRLLINEMILAHIAKLQDLTPEWIGRQQQSLAIVNHMANEICTAAASQAMVTDLGVSGAYVRPALRGIFMVIYPLTVAATATGVPDALRQWVIHTLEVISHTTGVRQAMEVIPQLQLVGANRGGIFNGV